MGDRPNVSKVKPEEVIEEGGVAIYEGDTRKYRLFPRVDKDGRLIIKTKVETLIERITPISDLYNVDKTVGTEVKQIDTDTLVREDVTILADVNNTDTVYIGNAEVQKFPLEPGAALTLRKVRLADIYAVSNTDNQIIHVISGGGYNVGGGYYA